MAWFSEPHTQEGQVVEAIRSVFIALLAVVRLLLLLLVFQCLFCGRNPLLRADQGTQRDDQSHGYPFGDAAQHTCPGSTK